MNILMTVEELAKYLKIKPDTIYKKVRRGELPAIKLGKLVRFPKELIDEWIVEQASKTMKEIKTAKQRVEARVGEAVVRVEKAVEQAMEHAESAVDEVRRTQESLSKNLRSLWKDLNAGITRVGEVAVGTRKKSAKPGLQQKIIKTKSKKSVNRKTKSTDSATKGSKKDSVQAAMSS